MAAFPEYVHNLFREASTGLSVDEMCAAYKIMGKMLDLHKRKEENDPKEVGNYQMDVGDTNEVPEITVNSDTALLVVNTEKEMNYEERNERQLQQENSTWPTIEVYFTASIYKELFPKSEADAINWKLHMWSDDLFFSCGKKNVVTDSLEIGQQVLNSGGTVFYVGKPKMCPPDAHLVFGKSPMHKGREIVKHFTGQSMAAFPDYLHNLFREASTGLSVEETIESYTIVGKMLDLHKRKEENGQKVGFPMEFCNAGKISSFSVEKAFVHPTNNTSAQEDISMRSASLPSIPTPVPLSKSQMKKKARKEAEKIPVSQRPWHRLDVYFTNTLLLNSFCGTKAGHITFNKFLWAGEPGKYVVCETSEQALEVMNRGGTAFFCGEMHNCPKNAFCVRYDTDLSLRMRSVARHLSGKTLLTQSQGPFSATYQPVNVTSHSFNIPNVVTSQPVQTPTLSLPVTMFPPFVTANPLPSFPSVIQVKEEVPEPNVDTIPKKSVKQEVPDPAEAIPNTGSLPSVKQEF